MVLKMRDKNSNLHVFQNNTRGHYKLLLLLLVTSVVSDSVQPQRRQPTRLPSPWDSPGKNTGVGCYFLLQCMKVKSESEVIQLCLTLCDAMDCSLPGSSVHWISQARMLERVAISFTRGSPDPGIKPVSPALQADSLPLSYLGSLGLAYTYFCRC